MICLAVCEYSRLVDKYKIESKFNGVVLDIDCLSTGCKTILNVLYFPNKVFCMKECGDNALEVLYGLENGAVYSDYAVIPFDMKEVRVSDKKGKRVIADYEELITILTGSSGTGKTASFSFMRECMAVNSDIVCIN